MIYFKANVIYSKITANHYLLQVERFPEITVTGTSIRELKEEASQKLTAYLKEKVVTGEFDYSNLKGDSFSNIEPNQVPVLVSTDSIFVDVSDKKPVTIDVPEYILRLVESMGIDLTELITEEVLAKL